MKGLKFGAEKFGSPRKLVGIEEGHKDSGEYIPAPLLRGPG